MFDGDHISIFLTDVMAMLPFCFEQNVLAIVLIAKMY